MDPLYEVIVIGGGPAGVAAAVYTARKRLKTLLVTESFGGQSIVSDDIQNWIGEPHISGLDLAKKLETHIKAYPDMVDVKIPEKVVEVKTIPCQEPPRVCNFEVKTDQGNNYRGKMVIVCSGARRRKMGIPGENNFEGKGVSYCSTCDAPLFKGRKVAVVGGGNAGLEAIIDLFPYVEEIYLLDRGEAIRGDQTAFEEVRINPKFKGAIFNARVLEILGEQLVTGLKYQDTKTAEEKILEVQGVFVEIGSVPNSELVKDLVQLDEHGQIIINFQHSRTSHPGIFAAGDVTCDPYKQSNISAGDGVKAALAAYDYLLNREKSSPAAEPGMG